MAKYRPRVIPGVMTMAYTDDEGDTKMFRIYVHRLMIECLI